MTGNEHSNAPVPASLIAYYRRLMATHRHSPGTYGNWRSNLIYLYTYVRASCKTDDVPLAELSSAWVVGYRDHLAATTLARNTTIAYFGKLRACLRSAYCEGLTERNLAYVVQALSVEETEREYLTLAELQSMAQTECHLAGLKRAFLFSCLTGLRRSDVEHLTWSRVAVEAGFTRIKFRQQKTRGVEYLDISPQAARLLGGRQESDERVFADFHYSSYALKMLRKWAERAGVVKHITYHTSRHTFALLLLSTGSDLYTVQRLLGHRSIETTQIYAHICDSSKREAVMRIPTLTAGIADSPAHAAADDG